MTLSDTLRHAAADDGTLELDLATVHRRATARRRRRGRATVASGILAIVALAGGATVAATADAPERETVLGTVVSGGGGEASSDDPTTTTLSDPAPPTSIAPETSAPATTAPVPATTSPPSYEPADMSLDLHGTYSVRTEGTVDGLCPSFTSRLSGTVVMDDGSTWQRSETGCFTTEDDHFRGEGTFVLAAPDGSTLGGAFLSEADLPTQGVPYGLEIVTGTGAYTGAIGSCTVTVAIVGGPLEQTQTGELTCSLAVSPPPSASSGSDPAGSVPEAD